MEKPQASTKKRGSRTEMEKKGKKKSWEVEYALYSAAHAVFESMLLFFQRQISSLLLGNISPLRRHQRKRTLGMEKEKLDHFSYSAV